MQVRLCESMAYQMSAGRGSGDMIVNSGELSGSHPWTCTVSPNHVFTLSKGLYSHACSPHPANAPLRKTIIAFAQPVVNMLFADVVVPKLRVESHRSTAPLAFRIQTLHCDDVINILAIALV